jgi:hypothetical protein
MKNTIYNQLLIELKPIFGSFTELDSKNGARFRAVKKGKITVYHADIAPGNKAEIAFETSSLAARIGCSVPQANAFVAELKSTTGCNVNTNPIYKWPRVGFATMEHVTEVVTKLTALIDQDKSRIEQPLGIQKPNRTERTQSSFQRNDLVKNWVLAHANGLCEGCDMKAPFVLDDGSAYLEVHHVRQLVNGGSDQITNAVALCPNCHRRSHLSRDRAAFSALLYNKVPRLVEE